MSRLVYLLSLPNLENHFSTIGLVGMNEACLNFLGCSICDEEGNAFAMKVLDFMRNKLRDFQEASGHIYNLEATPAEGTSFIEKSTTTEMFHMINCGIMSIKPIFSDSSKK